MATEDKIFIYISFTIFAQLLILLLSFFFLVNIYQTELSREFVCDWGGVGVEKKKENEYFHQFLKC